jgi:two-component system cell cycle sensor histidine kinase/response regulator CckA
VNVQPLSRAIEVATPDESPFPAAGSPDADARVATFESLGSLAAGVAHAFSNALTAIGGSAELLRDHVTDPAALEDVERIRATVAHASGITRQLLRLADRQVVRPEVIDLGDHVAEVMGWLAPLLGEPIRLVTELDPATGPVRIDPDEVAELILVLATNARDAMAGQGTLRLSVRRVETTAEIVPSGYPAPIGDGVPAGAWVVLEVADTGDGMSPEAQRNLFRPFFTTKRGRGAAGLGLAAAHAVVHRAGGVVHVVTAPDHGTVVRIHFPAVARPAPHEVSPPPSSLSPSGRGLSALLVEDDPDVRAFTSSALRRFGFEVLVASNPEEAIGRAAGHPDPIAVLVSDVVMPEMTGPALAVQLKAVRRDLAVLFMSGHPLDAERQLPELPPGAHFLRKPFGARDLAAAIAEAMGPAPADGQLRGRLSRVARPR